MHSFRLFGSPHDITELSLWRGCAVALGSESERLRAKEIEQLNYDLETTYAPKQG